MPDVIVPVVFFASLFGIVYVFLNTRHRERMALIEKGADPAMFHVKRRTPSYTLRFGLLFVGVALGILVGTLLHVAIPSFEEEPAGISMIFLFGGLALIVSYFLEKNFDAQKTGQVEKA